MNVAIFAPLRDRGNELLPLIATIGVSVIMQNAMLAWFGPIPYAFESPYSNDVIRFGGAFITLQNVLIIIVSIVTVALLYAFMKFTFIGKALRAVAQDRDTAEPDGDQSQSGRLADLRDRVGARRHGGRDAWPGAGAHAIRRDLGDRQGVRDRHHWRVRQRRGHDPRRLLVGLIESYTTQYLGPGLIDIVVFVLLLAMLAFRPTGLIAENRDENV